MVGMLDKADRTSIKNAVEHDFEIRVGNGKFYVKDKDDTASGYGHVLIETGTGFYCDCKAYEFRGNCKHVRALNLYFLRTNQPRCAAPSRPTVVEED
jgi:hypothetical protein